MAGESGGAGIVGTATFMPRDARDAAGVAAARGFVEERLREMLAAFAGH